jgi:hypothetical protein
MRKIIIDTDRQPVLLKVTVKSDKPCVLKFKGYDSKIENSTYFNRGYGTPEKLFVGTKTFCFPMPLSPKRLIFEVSCPKMENDVEILKVEKAKLKQADVWLHGDEQEYLDFIMSFVKQASYASPGVYVRDSEHKKGRQFIIIYKDELLDPDGNPVNTPARISRKKGIIEVNRQKFLSYSIPMRLIILVHEFVHWRNNTRIELECDKNAINLLLLKGFPKTEVMYSFTKIFAGKNYLKSRVKEVVDFIDSPKYRNLNKC